LYAYFTHAYEEVRSIGHGANQQNLSLELLERVWVPRPRDLGEQEDVYKVVYALQRRTETASSAAFALRQLFSATLDRLVRAEIRVKDIDTAEVLCA
jgi:type I restriction enzyme S subunit